MTDTFSRTPARRARQVYVDADARDIRWRLLDDVAAAREHWGLKDRSLTVLRALLTFLPRGERIHLVVFPSNRTLSERLMGMPESTIRRHLAILVEAGLLRRRDSSNRKRFRIGRHADLSFGFDLTPFFGFAHDIAEAAKSARMERERITELRARLRLVLANLEPDDPSIAAMGRLMRRKLSSANLEEILQGLATTETTATNSENGRHIQPEYIKESPTHHQETAITAMEEVAGIACMTDIRTQDLEVMAYRASLALGVKDAWIIAHRRHGASWAMLTLAYVNRRIATLNSPGNYMLALSRRAEKGNFDLLETLRHTFLLLAS